MAYNGSVFRVKVTNPCSEATSDYAVLSIGLDYAPPQLLRARGDASLERVIIAFLDGGCGWPGLDPQSVENLANYSLSDGLTVSNALVDTTGTNVVLTTSHQTPGMVYSLTVTNIFDKDGNGLPENATVQFQAWLPGPGTCDPGPAMGHSINHCYDDGYVYVDATGNALGYTSYWGFDASSQIVGDLVVFHNRTTVDSNTVQVVTDTYELGLIVPPVAPYAGAPDGLGPIIPDVPVCRSIESFITVLLSIHTTATNSVVISCPPSSAGWMLQQNDELNTSNWTDVFKIPAGCATVRL